MQSILQALALTPAPSGSETKIREKIQSFLSGAEMQVDAHGSLLVHKAGTGDGIVVLTAMDTPCLYVTYPEGGFSRFSAVGGLKPSDGMAVQCEKDILGVIGTDEKGQFLDTGAHTLEIGQWAVPLPSLYAIDEDKMAGASIGQYAAMTTVLSAILQETKQEAWFVFATKSHIRQLSPSFMQKLSAKKLLSVEVSAANDAPAEKTVFTSLGSGTTLRVKDEGMLSSPSFLAQLSAVPFKTYKEVSALRGTGGTVQKAYGGIESASLGIPVRYKGCPNEMVSLSDIQNTTNILLHLLQ